MTTSGTYQFNPSLGELVLYAYNLVGVRNTAILQEHTESARMAANLMLARWANQGVNLWAVDLQTITLIEGTATYTVPLNTVVMLDAYVTTSSTSGNPIDRIILPISRTEYASYPNKEQQGFPTTFWFDRLISPTPSVTLYPVPDGSSAQTMSYYRVRQIQDAVLSGGTNVEIPYLWMEAFAYGLAARLAAIWNPTIAPILKDAADEAYLIASTQNVETAALYISPMLSGYYR